MGGSEAASNPVRGFYAGRRVCVTGGAGFIGGHLAEALLLLDARVRIIDDLSSSDGEHVAGLVERYRDQARFIYGSILDPSALREAVASCDTVFHFAAVPSVPRSIDDPERAFEVNATGTLRVCEAARRAGARRVVYASSSSVYGDDATLPKSESMLPRPLSPYAASKLAGESIIRAWRHSYGLSGVSLRFFNVFGPRQPAEGPYAAVIASFLSRLSAGERPVIFGDGLQTRDFTPVANAVHASLLAGAAGQEAGGEAINIALGRRTSVREVFDVLCRLMDRAGLEPEYRDARPGDVPHSVADTTLARRLLGFEPVKGLDEGLAETAAWYASARPGLHAGV